MSTSLYLVCDTHEVERVAQDESASSLSQINEVIDDLRDREALVTVNERMPGGLSGYRGVSARFFTEHKLCAIGIIDEVNRRYDVITGDELTSGSGDRCNLNMLPLTKLEIYDLLTIATRNINNLVDEWNQRFHRTGRQ